MKITASLFVGILVSVSLYSQDERSAVTKACLDYIEGFYEGDTAKLARSLNSSLYKFGYFKNNSTGKYEPEGNMSYKDAIDYAKTVLAKKQFAREGSPKKVEVLDIMNSIASAKVTAWWGVDYLLLAKHGDAWKIDQVIWEGPLNK
jgi:hypothetical protein